MSVKGSEGLSRGANADQQEARAPEIDERALLKQLHGMPSFSPHLPDPPVAYLPQNLDEIQLLDGALNGALDTSFRRNLRLSLEKLQLTLETELARGAGFLLLPVSVGAGVVTYFTASHESGWLPISLTIAILAVMRWWLRERYYWSSLLLLAIFFQFGLLTAKFETWRYSTAMVGSDVTTKLTGRVVGLEEQFKGGWRLTVDVLSTERPVLRHAPERLAMTARDIPAQTEIGSTLTGFVRLRPHSGPVRPGNYDFAFNGYFKGNGGNGFYLGTPSLAETAASSGVGAAFSQAIAALRYSIGSRVTSALRGEDGAIAAALISGQRGGISERTNEALRNSGLAHILSISGLHLALAAGVVMIGFRSIASLFPSFAARHPVKKYAAVAALFSSAFYLTLSGADVAAQRSFVMIMVMLLALLVDRAALSIRNLAIAALIAFLSAPHAVLGPSFQMSFSATAGLIAAYAWWSDRNSTLYNQGRKPKRANPSFFKKWFTPLVATAATSIIAGVASGIYSAYHFNNTAPFGLIGNVLAMPVISIVIMPFAVLSLLLMPFHLDWLPLQIMGFGVWVLRQIAEGVSSIAPAGNPGIIPTAAILSWSIALVIAVITTTRLRMVSLIFIFSGFVFYFTETDPEIMIAEDARLVAVRLGDGRLAVNRPRASRFTLESWAKAYDVADIVPPVMASAMESDLYSESAFYCEEKICSITLSDGRMLSYTDEESAVDIACNIGDVVVLAVAGKEPSCSSVGKTIITRRDLALKGSLEIRLGAQIAVQSHPQNLNNPMARKELQRGAGQDVDAADNDEFIDGLEEDVSAIIQRKTSNQSAFIETLEYSKNALIYNDKFTYSVGDPQRPWHQHRLYSRAARGLGVYVPAKTKASGKITD